MTTYLIGRLLHRWGWLRVNWLAALAFMAAARLSRYIVVAAFA
jgi:membrane protein YqaA with SNARE-associated domain